MPDQEAALASLPPEQRQAVEQLQQLINGFEGAITAGMQPEEFASQVIAMTTKEEIGALLERYSANDIVQAVRGLPNGEETAIASVKGQMFVEKAFAAAKTMTAAT